MSIFGDLTFVQVVYLVIAGLLLTGALVAVAVCAKDES